MAMAPTDGVTVDDTAEEGRHGAVPRQGGAREDGSRSTTRAVSPEPAGRLVSRTSRTVVASCWMATGWRHDPHPSGMPTDAPCSCEARRQADGFVADSAYSSAVAKGAKGENTEQEAPAMSGIASVAAAIFKHAGKSKRVIVASGRPARRRQVDDRRRASRPRCRTAARRSCRWTASTTMTPCLGREGPAPAQGRSRHLRLRGLRGAARRGLRTR